MGGRARSVAERRSADVLPAFARAAVPGDDAVSRVRRSSATSSRSWASPLRRARFVDEIGSWCGCCQAAVRAGPAVLHALVRRRADDVGRRRADDRAGLHATNSKSSSDRRGGADEPVTDAARSDGRLAPGGIRGGGVSRPATACMREPKLARLCLAGGCAMNSVANGKIRERDAVHRRLHSARVRRQRHRARRGLLRLESGAAASRAGFVMRTATGDPSFGTAPVDAALADAPPGSRTPRLLVRRHRRRDELVDWTASRIADGQVVGWFQGRMEWGARALGNRSILADPRRADMREIINTKIKFREKFRPFAPSRARRSARRLLRRIGARSVHDAGLSGAGGQAGCRDPGQSRTSMDPGRLQTVNAEGNPRYWSLIRAFERQHRRADRAQHVVQRERTHRAPAGRGARLLPSDADGRAGAGQSHGREGPHQLRTVPRSSGHPTCMRASPFIS